MKQAIEEGYILNVLDNYVTWKTYCHINKTIDDDPELKTIAAKRKWRGSSICTPRTSHRRLRL